MVVDLLLCFKALIMCASILVVMKFADAKMTIWFSKVWIAFVGCDLLTCLGLLFVESKIISKICRGINQNPVIFFIIVLIFLLIIITMIVLYRATRRIYGLETRFVLDTMPGRQRAIDTDLNLGIITKEEAIIMRNYLLEKNVLSEKLYKTHKLMVTDIISIILTMLVQGGKILIIKGYCFETVSTAISSALLLGIVSIFEVCILMLLFCYVCKKIGGFNIR